MTGSARHIPGLFLLDASRAGSKRWELLILAVNLLVHSACNVFELTLVGLERTLYRHVKKKRDDLQLKAFFLKLLGCDFGTKVGPQSLQ